MAEETKVIRIVIDSSKAVDGSTAATRAMERMERGVASLDSSMSRMEQGLGRIGGYMKAHLALIAADIGARFLQMGKDSLKAAGDLEDLAEQLGVSTKGLQALQFAAVQGGMKLEQLETGVGKFSQKMGEAAGGSKEMIEALNAIGVKILDVNGKLRPTETLMTEVARAITSMEDPAKRSAVAVDFFGKAGSRMLPMLKDMAGGFDDMAEKARRSGAMISKEAIEKLKDLGDASERSQLKMRALFAENAAGPLTDALDFITKKMENLGRIIGGIKGDWTALLKFAALGPAGLVAGALAASPVEKLEKDLAAARTQSSAMWDNLGNATTDRDKARMMSAYVKAQEQVAALERQQNVMNIGGKADYRPSDPDGVGVLIANKPGGARNPGVTGAGQGEADRIAKLGRDTSRELEAANAYAAASERGARAVADLEIHFKALKAAQDAYGTTADKNAGQVAALTTKIEEQMKAAERAKSLKDFNLGTEDLERANELLAAENGLLNANVETRARELALIKLKHDVQSKGLDENNAAEKLAIDRRAAAIEQNERLKAQGEELKKANEIWTEPLKNALQSLQSFTTDWLDGMLEKGSFTFAELSNFGTRMARRIIAEFASLAIMRPMIGSMMGGMQSLGLVSPQTRASRGYGGSSGAGGGFSLPGFSGSGMFGGLGDWLNTPFTGPYAGMSPSSMQGVPMLSGSAGITPLGALGAAAGIGMGAYQLATSKTTAGTIGGIGSMLGAGISLIPGMAPVGMGISLLSSILPGLFGGGGEYQWAPLAGAEARFNPGAGGYTMANTQQNGGASTAGQYGNVASTINALYAATGGTINYGLATGGAVWNNQREGTTSTYAIHPWLGSLQLSEGSGDQSGAVDRMIAKMFYMTMTTPGATSGMSGTLGTALGNKEPTSVAAIQSLLSLVDSYDKLGKVTTSAESALKEINAQFAALTAGANEYGLSLTPIITEQKKITTRFAQDFIDGMLDPMAVQMRALADERKDALASAEYIRDNVKDVYVDMARISEFYVKKERDLKEQAMAASVDNLQALVRRLTYGDLAAATPGTNLAGTRGTYEAMLAQARAGSTSARNNLAGFAEVYAGSVRTNFASSAEGAALIEQIRRDILEVIGSAGGGIGSTGAAGSTTSNAQANASMNMVAELKAMASALIEQGQRQSQEITALTAQLKRSDMIGRK